MRLLAALLLNPAAREEIEVLVVAADLDIALEREGVVALHQGVEGLVQTQRLAA